MKKQELKMIERISRVSKSDIKVSDYEYSRFDAYNDRSIFEVKYRNDFYEDVLIEFDKFSYNHAYAMVNGLNFVYAVEMKDTIYIFDIVKLVNQGFDFKWEWRDMPKTTEFKKNNNIKKYVGYIHIKHSYCEL